MMEELSSTNINTNWLDNIFKQLIALQSMERIMREGCETLLDYIEIPRNLRHIIIPEAQYKNLKLYILELDMLIANLSPILKKKDSGQKNKITLQNEKDFKQVLKDIHRKELFLKEDMVNNSVSIKLTGLFDATLDLVLKIKNNLIEDIGHLLFLPEGAKKTW